MFLSERLPFQELKQTVKVKEISLPQCSVKKLFKVWHSGILKSMVHFSTTLGQ